MGKSALSQDVAELTQDFLDSCDARAYLKDKDGRFLMVNRRLAETSHLRQEDLIGKTSYDLLPKEEADKLTALDRQVASSGIPVNGKITLSLPSGKVTFLDHKFPARIEGYPNAVGGIAIEIADSERQKTLARQALEMWSSDFPDTSRDLYAQAYINHQEPDVAGGVSDLNLEEWNKLVHSFRAAFPNAKVRILTQVAEDDRVATRWETTARHQGRFLGLEATNREATWTGIRIDRFENGRMVESWVDWDKFRFLYELGLTR